MLTFSAPGVRCVPEGQLVWERDLGHHCCALLSHSALPLPRPAEVTPYARPPPPRQHPRTETALKVWVRLRRFLFASCSAWRGCSLCFIAHGWRSKGLKRLPFVNKIWTSLTRLLFCKSDKNTPLLFHLHTVYSKLSSW